MVLYDSMGQLILNVSLFSGGALFGVLGLLFGFTRGMTKNEDVWAILFSSLAWLTALMIPNVVWASGVFIAGAIGVTMAFLPLFKHVNQSNILVLAFVVLVMNTILLIGFGAYSVSLTWSDSYDTAYDSLPAIFTSGTAGLEADITVEGTGLCTPQQERTGTCPTSSGKSEATSGSFTSLIFDPFASVFAIPVYIGKAVNLAGHVVAAPLAITNKIKAQVANPFVAILMGIYATLWIVVIIYNAVMFILGNRGKT